ncbi:MAG: DNA methyltransferase [Planctomycetota bacterium]
MAGRRAKSGRRRGGGRPERPALRLQTTTLWYYPSQQYSDVPMGTPGYEGRTPAWVVWNLLERYTREEDLVVDPFCGGGTTLDVARDLGRRGLGYDLRPVREDVFRADARDLPLEDGKADFVFMDPPYSTHVEYSDDPRCIGKLSAFDEAYFEAMEAAFSEADRILRDRRYIAVYVSDSFEKKRGFVPIGARLSALLSARFRPIDHVAVTRGNRKLEKPAFHRAAAEGNFYLRGFQHLLVFKKERG